MQTFLNQQFWLHFLYFWIAVFFSIYIPGSLVLKRLRLNGFENHTLSLVIGIVLLSWQGMIFGYLQVRWLTYVYLTLTSIVWFWFFIKEKHIFNFPKIQRSTVLLIFLLSLGVLAQLTITWFAGIQFKDGVYYCCGDTRDNILHIAYVNQIVHNFPPIEPGLQGVTVKNYHYWGHITVAELVRVFHLPLVNTTMQYIPLLLSILYGCLGITFGRLLKLKQSFTLWLIFFLYFAGDSVYLTIFVLQKTLNFHTSIIAPATNFLVNYPMAFSLIVFLGGLNIFAVWSKERKTYIAILVALILGSVIGFKVNTAIASLCGLLVTAGYLCLKKNFQLVIPSILAVLLSLIIYAPVNLGTGGLFYSGFWRVENWVVQPIFNLSRYELAREVYRGHNNWPVALLYDLLFTLFYFLSFGTILIGFIQLKKSVRVFPREIHIFLISGIFICSIIGLFFLQNPGGANSIFFLITAYIIASFYAALTCSYWLNIKKSRLYIILAISIIMLTIPESMQSVVRNIVSIKNHIGYVINNEELRAFDYIQSETPKNSIVLVEPNTGLNYEAPYVGVYTDRPMFLSNVGNELITHGIPFAPQALSVNIIFSSTDGAKVRNELIKNRIKYIYMGSNKNLAFDNVSNILDLVFSNNTIKIYEVR
jgi:hypothetical protein